MTALHALCAGDRRETFFSGVPSLTLGYGDTIPVSSSWPCNRAGARPEGEHQMQKRYKVVARLEHGPEIVLCRTDSRKTAETVAAIYSAHVKDFKPEQADEEEE